MKKKVLIIFIINIFILTQFICTSFAATQADLDNLRQQQQQAQNEKNQISNQKKNEQSELEKITDELGSLKNEIMQLESELNELDSSISKKEEEITEKEKELKEKEELLKKRLVAMYKSGGISYLDVLLGATSYMDMLASIDALERIAEADTNLINKVSNEKKELEDAKAQLESEKKRVDMVKAEKDAKNVVLKQKQSDKESQISSLNEEEKKKQAEIDSYNEAMARVNRELQEAARKAQEQMNNNGINFDGSFIWPCNNRLVTSTVKRRWGRMHKGIDIGASYENVYASATGYAYNAYDRYGYGTYIMVFHGSGYVSLYGHLSASRVSNGQLVSQGQVIATSGNSGSSTAPHLHFELRQASTVTEFFSKSPLNPLNYLPGGYTLAAGATTES